MPQVAINMDNLLTPSRSTGATDPYEGYRLGKAAVTAEQFPRGGKTVDDFTAKLNRHFVRVGLQLLNEQKRVQVLTRDEQTLRVKFVGEFTTISVDDLVGQLWDCIPVDAVNWSGEFEGPRSYRLSVERMDRLVTLAAMFAVESWNPRWEAENRRRARKGGQSSTRGKSVSLEAVQALLGAVEHLPERNRASAIAALLSEQGTKCSAKTVKRRLDEMKAAPEAPAPEAVERPMEPLDTIPVERPFWVSARTQSDTRFFARHEEMLEQARVTVTSELTDFLDDVLAG